MTRNVTGWRERAPILLPILALAWVIISAPHRWENDSFVVYQGTRELAAWLTGFRSRADLLPFGPFPIFQYLTGLPAVLLASKGLPVETYRLWVWMNMFSVGAMALLAFRIARAGGATVAGWIAAIVILCGPMVAYATTTFNEATAALVACAFVAAVTGQRGAIASALLFFVAAMTKEFAVALLIPVWIAALVLRRSELSRRDTLAHLIAMITAAIAAVGVHAAFNLLRYGVSWNREYLLDELLVHNPRWAAENFLSLWFSPSGGIIAVWPAMVLMLALVAIQVLRNRGDGTERSSLRGGVAHFIPLLATAIMLLGLFVGLSGWYQPFGWWAWGPRLMLPWFPPAMMLLLRAYPTDCENIGRCFVNTRSRLVVTSIAIALLSLPHVALTVSGGDSIIQFFNDPAAPQNPDPLNPAEMRAGSRYFAWQRTPPMIIWPLRELVHLNVLWPTLVYCAGLTGLAVLAHKACKMPVPSMKTTPINLPLAAAAKTCPQCGKTFTCGAESGNCWCASLPHALPLPDGNSDCFCPDCLTKKVSEQPRAAESQ